MLKSLFNFLTQPPAKLLLCWATSMNDIGTQTSPPEVGIADLKSFEWEHLEFDPEEICKARFRHLLDHNSFLRGSATGFCA